MGPFWLVTPCAKAGGVALNSTTAVIIHACCYYVAVRVKWHKLYFEEGCKEARQARARPFPTCRSPQEVLVLHCLWCSPLLRLARQHLVFPKREGADWRAIRQNHRIYLLCPNFCGGRNTSHHRIKKNFRYKSRLDVFLVLRNRIGLS